jgi:hypothetical protein
MVPMLEIDFTHGTSIAREVDRPSHFPIYRNGPPGTFVVFTGAPVDARDGFIHFSTAAQVVETAARHFAGASNLQLVAVGPRCGSRSRCAMGTVARQRHLPASLWRAAAHAGAVGPSAAARWTRAASVSGSRLGL